MYVHNRRYQKKRSKKPPVILFVLAIFVVGMLYGFVRAAFVFPTVHGVSEFERTINSDQELDINWPGYGQSAIGAVGYGVLETSGATEPQPTASVAKVMTVLTVLNKYPLNLGEEGEVITISEEDAALFGEYWSKNGTSVKVAAGSELSMYKALQYVLIPSANNIADTLVIWAFGSMDEYVEEANKYAKDLGLESSYFADASGFSPDTTSTASDLVKLGEHAMNNPVVKEIVNQWQVTLPDGNKAQNSNVFLDFEGNGVIGIKTGDTDQAKGVYLFAAEHEVDGQTVTIIGTVMGAKTLFKAQQDSMKLLAQAKKGFKPVKIIEKDELVGTYKIPWQEAEIQARSDSSGSAILWANQSVEAKTNLSPIKGEQKPGDEIGVVEVSLGSETIYFPAHVDSNVDPPPRGWRFTHPQFSSLFN